MQSEAVPEVAQFCAHAAGLPAAAAPLEAEAVMGLRDNESLIDMLESLRGWSFRRSKRLISASY